jgi:hypothetical protein
VWRGQLWFGAANTGVLYRMPVDRRGVAPREAAAFDDGVIDVAVGPDGALYVATATAIHRLVDDAPSPISPRATPADDATPTAGPVVMPDRGDDEPSAAVPIVAAVIIAAALLVRLRAGRTIGRDLDDA